MSRTHDPTALVRWATSQASPLDDERTLAEILGEARVIAVGEPGHGAQEPLEFRNDVIRRLVQRREIDAIALESGLLESRDLDAYVTGGERGLATEVSSRMTWGFGKLQANVDLLQWLRAYNASHDRAVRLFGFDLPGGDCGELSKAYVATEAIARFLKTLMDAESAALAGEIDELGQRLNRPAVASMDDAARDADRELLQRVHAHLAALDHRRTDGPAHDEWQWAVRAVHQARAVFEMLCLWPDVPVGSTVLPGDKVAAMLQASAIRDIAMAENVEWLLQRAGPEARMLIFAANGHVIADEHLGGLWLGHRGLGAAAGQHLRRRFGSNYRVLLTASAAISSNPRARASTSLDAWLDAVPRDNFLVSMRDAPPDPWLDQEQSSSTNGMSPQAFIPRRACDGVAYFRRMTPAQRVGQS